MGGAAAAAAETYCCVLPLTHKSFLASSTQQLCEANRLFLEGMPHEKEWECDISRKYRGRNGRNFFSPPSSSLFFMCAFALHCIIQSGGGRCRHMDVDGDSWWFVRLLELPPRYAIVPLCPIFSSVGGGCVLVSSSLLFGFAKGVHHLHLVMASFFPQRERLGSLVCPFPICLLRCYIPIGAAKLVMK